MPQLRWFIANKIIGMNGIMLFLMVGSLSYVYLETRNATPSVETQRITLSRLETAHAISERFSELRYWLTEYALSWQTESEENANKTDAEWKELLATLVDTSLIALNASILVASQSLLHMGTGMMEIVNQFVTSSNGNQNKSHKLKVETDHVLF